MGAKKETDEITRRRTLKSVIYPTMRETSKILRKQEKTRSYVL